MATARAVLGLEGDQLKDEPESQAATSAVRASSLRLKNGQEANPAGFEPVKGKWTIVEQFVRDGFQYQVRRRKLDAQTVAPRLTKREEQVLMHARDGSSNKSIAYALGLAPSTVGVLLFRAAAKLGAK